MPSTIPERVGADVRLRLERAWIASVSFVTVLGIMAPGGVKAEIVQDFINYVMLAISYVLQWVLFFMGKLVLLITDVVVDVAQYNSFVDAAPVQNGWPLVRDVVNMFFIVVLLVTAFSTIVQWKKFDYRKILPKLLLMAVLVNFSKQLIGLLIDFSQILMLTFVNGFKAAAGGNFVNALKLNKLMKFDESKVQKSVKSGYEDKDSVLLKIVLSEFLGIFFMGTTIVMLLIMLVYLIVRVVGLWIALIFSPAALFVTALSGTPVASKVSLVGDKYWSRLGALLSGGPIMAFFLWLTLSTVQGKGITGFNVSVPPGEESANYFSSAIGNAQDVATYFVALIMLLMGVEAAVAVSGEIGSTMLSGAVGKIKTGGMAATRFAAYGGMAAVAGYAARGAGRAAERKLELRERLGRGLQAVAGGKGVVGGTVGTLATMAGAARAGAALRRGRAAERAEEAKKVEGGAYGMDAAQRMQYLTNASRGLGEKSREAGVMLARQELAPEGAKVMLGQIQAEGKEKGLAGEDLAAYTQTQVAARQGGALSRLEQTANARGDQDLLKYVREQKEQRPDLLKEGAFEEARHRLMGMTPEEIASTVKAEAFKDTRITDAVIQRMLKSDGTLDETSLDYEKLAKGRGLRAELIRQRHAELATEAKASGQPLSITSMNQAFAASNMAGAYMARVEEGDRVRYVSRSAEQMKTAQEKVTGEKGAAAGGEEWEKPIRRESEINAAKERLARARAEAEGPAKMASMAQAQQGMMAAGAPMTEAFAVDQKGTFASDADRTAFQMTVQNIEGGKLGMDVVQNMDFDLLQQNQGGRNEARSVFVEQMSSDGLSKMARDATSSQNRAAQRRVTQMAQVVDMEGARAEKTLAQANLKLANKMDLGQITGEYEKAKKSGDMSGFQRQLDAIEAESGVKITQADVGAISKRQDMNADPTIQAYKKSMSARTANQARRVGKGVAVGGAAVGAAAVGGAAAVSGAARRRFTTTGRAATMDADLTRRAARTELRGGAVGPAIAPAGPGGPPRRRPDVPLGPPPTPPSPPPPPPPTIPDLEVPPPRPPRT